jgi:hypothetical protein
MYVTMAGPPNAVNPNRKKEKKREPREGCCEADDERGSTILQEKF